MSTRILDVHKKHDFMASVHTGVKWVKPAQPAKPIFLTPILLLGALPGDVESAG